MDRFKQYNNNRYMWVEVEIGGEIAVHVIF